jgi:hypothetical protein
MMDGAMEKILINCLEGLERGRTIDEVLADNPEKAQTLLLLLQTHVQLAEFRVAHSLKAQTQSKKRMLAHAETMRVNDLRGAPVCGFFRRLALSFATLVLIFVISSMGIVVISGSALPGMPFYAAKLAIEEIRFSLTDDVLHREALRDQYGQERIEEIKKLLAKGQKADVVFRGSIELLKVELWYIAGVPVHISSTTIIRGSPQPGLVAEVEGRTDDGKLLAVKIVVTAEGEIIPNPAPRPDKTDELPAFDAEEPTVTPTSTPLSSPTATSTQSIVSTATPTATAIITQIAPNGTPVPTPQPEDPDGDDDDVDDGDDDDEEGGGDDPVDDDPEHDPE